MLTIFHTYNVHLCFFTPTGNTICVVPGKVANFTIEDRGGKTIISYHFIVTVIPDNSIANHGPAYFNSFGKGIDILIALFIPIQ